MNFISKNKYKYTLASIFFALLFFLQPSPADAATYNIDSSISTVYGTSFGGIKGGDILCLAPGTRGRITFSGIMGDATNPIIIKNCGGQTTFNGAGVTNHTVTFSGGSRYFRFTGTGDSNYKYGIKILNSGVGTTAGASAIVATGRSSDMEFDNLEINGPTFAGLLLKTDPGTAECVSTSSYFNFIQYNTLVHDNLISNSEGEGVYAGSSFYASGHSVTCNGVVTKIKPHELRGVKMYNNIINDAGWDGIQVGAATENVDIYNNKITNAGRLMVSAQNSSIQINPGTVGTVRNNYVDGGGYGLFMSGWGDNTVYNNTFLNSRTDGIMTTNNIIRAGYGYSFDNNLIINPGRNGIYFLHTNTTDSTIRNNIIVSTGTGKFIVADPTKQINFSMSNNLNYTSTTSVGFVDPVNKNFRLSSNSPAKDGGVSTINKGVDKDADNIVRPQGLSYDVGPFEFTSSTVPVADSSAPSAPSSLVATTFSSSQINLNWVASSDNVGVTGYRIYQDGIQKSTSTGTSYSATGLASSTTYIFYVVAVDAAGNISSSSGNVSATTNTPVVVDSSAPSAPTLSSNNTTTSGTSLSWTVSTDNVGIAGYDIYQNSTFLATTPSISYTVSGLASNTTYSYYVKARDAAGNTTSSNVVSLTTTAQIGVSSLTLVNASTDTDIVTMFNGMTIDLSSSGSSLNIRANTNPTDIGSVQFLLDGSIARTENNPPYTFAGDVTTSTTDYYPWTPTVGSHTVVANLYSGDNATGTLDGSLSISFNVINSAIVVDSSDPSAPSSLVATTFSSSQINLNWVASSDNVGVTGYRIYQDGIQKSTSTGTSYSATGLASSTTYIFYVVAVDAAGNISSSSGNVSATTNTPVVADSSAPSAPSSLVATTFSSSQINLNWVASSDNVGVTGYRIYQDGIQKSTSTGTSYSATGLASSTTYIFYVVAVDAAGNISSNSTSVSATTESLIPPVIDTQPPVLSTISYSITNSKSVLVSWTTNEPASSIVEYGLTKSFEKITVETDTSPRVTSHYVTLPDILCGSMYYIRAKSVDAAGNLGVSLNYTFNSFKCTRKTSLGSWISEYLTASVTSISDVFYEAQEIPVNEYFSTILRIGSRGEEVKKIQYFLRSQDLYKGKIDGGFGPITQNAIKAFQEKYRNEILSVYNLKNPTGIWWYATMKKANEINNASLNL